MNQPPIPGQIGLIDHPHVYHQFSIAFIEKVGKSSVTVRYLDRHGEWSQTAVRKSYRFRALPEGISPDKLLEIREGLVELAGETRRKLAEVERQQVEQIDEIAKTGAIGTVGA